MRRDLTMNNLGDLAELGVLAVLATYRQDSTVLLSPVWHEWRDGVPGSLSCGPDGSGEGYRVVAADGSAAAEHRGVHADVDRIVLRGCPQDPRIFGQVTLRQRDHHAAGAGFGD